MKTTIDIPDKLLREIKLLSVKRGKKLRETVEELLRVGLAAGSKRQKNPKRPAIAHHSNSGFPYIPCAPDAPASRMTAAQLGELEQQIELQAELERLGVLT